MSRAEGSKLREWVVKERAGQAVLVPVELQDKFFQGLNLLFRPARANLWLAVGLPDVTGEPQRRV